MHVHVWIRQLGDRIEHSTKEQQLLARAHMYIASLTTKPGKSAPGQTMEFQENDAEAVANAVCI